MAKITYRKTDKLTRQAMRQAHDEGRHGPENAPVDVLTYWAETCADCNARYRYEIS